jgi:hypothetical protein
MALDIAMGGSTNTILHLLAVAQEAEVDFKMSDIDQLSRRIPCLCKLAPNTQKYSVQECNRAGGILGIRDLSKKQYCLIGLGFICEILADSGGLSQTYRKNAHRVRVERSCMSDFLLMYDTSQLRYHVV